MTPSLESNLRAKLHRIIDEVFAATTDGAAGSEPLAGAAPVGEERERAEALLSRLRRLAPALGEGEVESPIRLGELTVDLAGHEVFVSGRRIPLTHREFGLLRHLAVNRGRACSREELVLNVWADRELTSLRTVDIHVHRLRHKLGPCFSEHLETLRNVGYKLRVAVWHKEAPQEARPRRVPVRNAAHHELSALDLPRAYADAPANLTASLGPAP
ncbi:MAG: winged helix-turn-helix domain-containing protein [Myxococcales bacterium]